MDVAHNKISQELPYDAVANQINSSITQFKDGKDQYLADGITDRERKAREVEAFYARLKAELAADGPENEITSNGTSIGRFLVNNNNDMVEKSTESLASETGGAIPVMKLMLRRQVIPVSAMCVKLGKNVRDISKKGFIGKLPTLSVPDDYSKYKDTYIKGVLEQTVGEKLVDINFSSLSEYLRDTINIFSKNRDDSKEYFDRYIKRYSLISDICSELALNINDLLSTFKKLFENNKDGLSKSMKDNTIDDITKSTAKIVKMYNDLISSKITDDDDYFTLVTQDYKFDGMDFTVTKNNKLEDTYSGITKHELLDAIKQKSLYAIENPKKTVFTSVYSPKGINKIIEGMQSSYNNISMESLMDKQKKPLYTVVDDMTVGEFYDQITKFNKYTKDFKEDVDDIVVKLIDSTTRAANITGTLATYTLNAIEKFSNMQQPADYNIAMLALSIASWTCIDLMTVVNSMHYINANDLVMKMYLYENTVNFVKYIDDCIQSWRK